MADALSWSEIDRQRTELLPARTVLSALGSCHPGSYAAPISDGDAGGGSGDTGGPGGWGGDGGRGGDGYGGPGGDGGDATVVGYNYGDGFQVNIAIAGYGGHGGDGYGGDANGGDGGHGGDGGCDCGGEVQQRTPAGVAAQ